MRQQRENRFDQHLIVPFATLTNLQVFWLICFAAKAFVRKHDHFVGNSFDHRKKFLIRHIHRFHRPISDESELVCHNTNLSADDPLPGSETFLPDFRLVRLMNFMNRVTKFNSLRVDHPEDCWFGKKLSSQSSMRFQTTKESRMVRQSGKQINPVLSGLTIKLVLRTAFESEQQARREQLADRKFGFNMFLRFWQHLVYTAKKFYDKVFLSCKPPELDASLDYSFRVEFL